MFDIAYECELSMEYFSDLKERLWSLVPPDCCIPFIGFVELLNWNRAYSAYEYWSLMYLTHGV